jgi:LysM repeat protein
MRTKFLLSENEVNNIAQNTVANIQKDNFKRVFGTLFNELNTQKGVHIRNMKKMNESERVIYLEEMMDNYVLDLFPRTNYIHEQFDKKFTDNILLESSNHSFRTLYDFFDFLKSSVLYECGFLNRRNFNIPLNEQGFLQNVGNAINKGYQTVKKGIQKGVELGKKAVKAVAPYVTKFLDSEFARWVPGVNVIKAGYDVYKIYQNWEKIKKMTFEDWVEEFRAFLNGTTGVVLQIVLALTGVGNIANWIANGLMLIYDVAYQGIGKGNWNWYNILTSAIALVATGAGAAAFKIVGGLLKGVTAASKIAPALAKSPQVLSKVAPLIKSMGGGIGKIMGWVMKAFTTLTTKFPLIGRFLKPLGGAINKIKGFLDEVVSGFQTYFKKGVLQNSPTVKNIKALKGSHAHFDTASIAKKLLATGDKTLTKKMVGGLAKVYYTVLAGDTLQKIVSKFKPQGVTADVLKQLNYDHGLEIKPGHKVRVA